MSLTTSARVKTALGIPAGVTFHDDAITQAVDYANDYVLRAIGQPGGLVGTTRTDYPAVYSDCQQDILLDRAPVISMIAVTNANSAVAASDYRADLETGMVRLNRSTTGGRTIVSAWSNVPDDVIISYLHGYTSATVPGTITRCADIIAVHNMQQTVNLGKTRVRNSSFGFDVDQMVVPAAASQILANFEDIHHT